MKVLTLLYTKKIPRGKDASAPYINRLCVAFSITPSIFGEIFKQFHRQTLRFYCRELPTALQNKKRAVHWGRDNVFTSSLSEWLSWRSRTFSSFMSFIRSLYSACSFSCFFNASTTVIFSFFTLVFDCVFHEKISCTRKFRQIALKKQNFPKKFSRSTTAITTHPALFSCQILSDCAASNFPSTISPLVSTPPAQKPLYAQSPAHSASVDASFSTFSSALGSLCEWLGFVYRRIPRLRRVFFSAVWWLRPRFLTEVVSISLREFVCHNERISHNQTTAESKFENDVQQIVQWRPLALRQMSSYAPQRVHWRLPNKNTFMLQAALEWVKWKISTSLIGLLSRRGERMIVMLFFLSISGVWLADCAEDTCSDQNEMRLEVSLRMDRHKHLFILKSLITARSDRWTRGRHCG